MQWNALIYFRPPRTFIRIFLLLTLTPFLLFFCPFHSASHPSFSKKSIGCVAKAGMEEVAKVSGGPYVKGGGSR